MHALVNDLRFALRLLRKSPLFTAIAILTLALGIGLNAAVFSAVEAMVLRPLPGVRQPEELVMVYRSYPGGFRYGANSIPHLEDLRKRGGDVFRGVAAWRITPLNLSSDGQTARVMGVLVSANYFSVLGVSPMRGRMFASAEDEGIGAHPVAVVSHAAWQTTFGGDPNIVGRVITLNGRKYTIIGIAPKEFHGIVPILTPALYVPLMQLAEVMPGTRDRFEDRGSNFLDVVARLQPGVSVERGNERMKSVMRDLTAAYPNSYTDSGIELVRQPDAGINPKMRSAQVGLSSVVMGVVVLLLLIACVNVANLFLARARERSREMAVRLSLGAPRSRLLRQLLTESFLFAGLAAAAGLALAWWVIGIVNGIELPIDVSIDPGLRLSSPVLWFTLATTLVTALLFGLLPALQATRPSLVPALKGEAPAGGSRSALSRALVVAQVALSLVLLVTAGLFLRSLGTATNVDKGFDPDNLLLASVDPGLQGYDRARSEVFYHRLVERLRALPGVKAVGLGEMVQLSAGNQQRGIDVPGYTPSKNENMSIDYNIVTPGYFAAMGIRVRGREFTDRDDSTAAGAVVVNERMAQRFWPKQDALGKRIHHDGRDFTVVGVVPNGKYSSLGEPPLSYMYYPQAQLWNYQMVIHLRTAGDPAGLAPALRAEVASLDPDLPVSNLVTMRRALGFSLMPARLLGAVLGVFGLLGLVLAAVGMYGVMAYTVAQRTREIGIRMAVGAASEQVLGLVVRQGLRLVVLGSIIGLAGAAGAAMLVRGLLYGTQAFDPVTFVGVPSILVGVALLAIWVPARRAARMDPVVALRAQ